MLNLREKALEDKRLEMAKVIKLLNDCQTQAELLEKKYSSYKAQINLIMEDENCIDVKELAGYNSYLVQTRQDIKGIEAKIEQVKKVLAVKQKEVSEALKDVKILDKLKETQSKKFYDAMYKKETEEIDDIVTARYKLQEI